MATALSLTIINDEHIDDLEFFLNSNGKISINAIDNEYFFSEISKEDWQVLKEFIDKQFTDG